MAQILKDNKGFKKRKWLERNWPKSPPMREHKECSEWQLVSSLSIKLGAPCTCILFLSMTLDQTYYDVKLWLKTRHPNKGLPQSIEAQVNWGWIPNPAGFKEHLRVQSELFSFLPVCSRSPSAALAVISAPLTLCLGYLPGFLLSSSVGAAQLSKKLFLVCPSQHWKKKNAEIVAWKVKEALVTVPNALF